MMGNREIILTKPDGIELAPERANVESLARSLTVRDEATHHDGQDLLKSIAGLEKRVTDLFAMPKKAAHDAHKAITAAEKELLAPISQARAIVTSKLNAYELEERRKASDKARELQEQARQQEQERQLMDAIAAEESGDSKTAEEIISQPIEIPTITVEAPISKVDGISTRVSWKAEVIDLFALIKWVSINREWMHLLEPAMPALNSLARSQREQLKIPGVHAVSDMIKSVKG